MDPKWIDNTGSVFTNDSNTSVVVPHVSNELPSVPVVEPEIIITDAPEISNELPHTDKPVAEQAADEPFVTPDMIEAARAGRDLNDIPLGDGYWAIVNLHFKQNRG